MRPYCGRECPSGPAMWMLCHPAHAISSARRSPSVMGHAPGSRRFGAVARGGSGSAVLVAGEHGHELLERHGADRLGALGAGGRGLVLGDDQPEAACLSGVGDGGRAAGSGAPHAEPVVRAVGGEAADGNDVPDSVHRELAGHGEQGQRDRQFERARVPAGGQGRISGAGGLEAHVGANLADAEPLQGVGDGGRRLLRLGVADAGDVESSGSVGGGGHREQVPVDAACVRAVDLHWMHFLSVARTGRS